jgi:hemolysin III
MDGRERSPLYETPEEEMASMLTHAVGAALSIVALILIVARAEGTPGVTSPAIFGASLITLYLSSTFYHIFTGTRLKAFF